MKRNFLYGIAFTAALSVTAFLFAGGASRDVRLESVENPRPSFYVGFEVDHDDLVYTEGDLLQATVSSTEDGYLYLFYKNANDEVSLLYPNKFNADNKIRKNEKICVPNEESKFQMRVTEPFGEEQMLAVVTKEPITEISIKGLGDEVTSVNRSFWVEFEKGLGIEEKPSSESYANYAECLLKITTVPKDAPRTTVPARRIAICIGVSKYQDKSIPPLPACRSDVEQMADLFVKKCGVDKENVWTLLDEEATLENVKKVFCEILPEFTKPGDIIFLYWSGHGTTCGDESGDEKDGFDEIIVPYDAVYNDPETMLVDDEFGRWVQKLLKRKIFFIIDACHSAGNATQLKSVGQTQENTEGTLAAAFKKEGFGKTSVASVNRPFDFGFGEASMLKDLEQRDLTVLASSAADESSLVRLEGDASVMTYYILEELNQHPGMTHRQLFDAVKPKVEDYVRKNFNLEQTPLLQDDLTEPLILNP